MSIASPKNRNILEKKFIIILGAPRSGTSWLNNILADHPVIAGLRGELKTFNFYVKPIVEAWSKEQNAIEQGFSKQGHPSIMSRNDLDDFILWFLNDTYSKVLEKNPKATHILDKHPGYSIAIEEILHYIPHAKIIHLIRDGRDVVPSMISAKERIGFGEGTVLNAIKSWKRSILACQQGKNKHPNNFLDVKYEELRNAGRDLIPKIFDFCELDCDDKMIDEIIENNRYDKNAVSRPDPQYEELREKRIPVWKVKLSVWERYQIHTQAGGLLQELGYIENGNWWYDSVIDKLKLPFLKVKHRIKRYF